MAGGRPPLKRQRVLLSPGSDQTEPDVNLPAEGTFQLRRMTTMHQWPFVNEAQEIRVQLVDHTLTEQYDKDVHVYVQMMRKNVDGVEMDESRFLNADKRVLQLNSTGLGSFVFSISKTSCGPDADEGQHPYHLVLAAKSRTPDIPAIETWISPPISVVSFRLEIAHEASEIPTVWFKDKGGKRNVIKVAFTLRDAEHNLIKDRIVKCKATLKYESGEKVPAQKILVVRPESRLALNDVDDVKSEGKGSRSSLNGAPHAPSASMGFALVRIDEVSKNHRGQSFMIEIGPDLEEQPENRDIGCLNTAAIAVRSKQNSGRPSRTARAPAEALPKFPPPGAYRPNGDAAYRGIPAAFPPVVSGVNATSRRSQFEQRVQRHATRQAVEQTRAALSQVTQAQAVKAHAEAQAQVQQVQAEAVRAAQAAATAAQSAQLSSATIQKNAVEAQSALMRLVGWVKEVEKLKSIEWTVCGVDVKGEPLHFIPGNPNPVIAPILQGYHEHVERNLLTIAKALQMSEMQGVLKPSPSVSASPHIIALTAPQMPVNAQITGKPIVSPVLQTDHSQASAQGTQKQMARDNSLYPIDQLPGMTAAGALQDQVKSIAPPGVSREASLLGQPQRQDSQHGFGSQTDLTRIGVPQPFPIGPHYPSFEHGSSMDSIFEMIREKPSAAQSTTLRAQQVANVHFVLAESYPNADPLGKKQCLPALDENRNLLGFIVVPDGSSRANWTFECWTTFEQITNEDKIYLSELVLKHQQSQHVKLKVVRGERQISEMIEQMLAPPENSRFEFLSPAGVLQAMK